MVQRWFVLCAIVVGLLVPVGVRGDTVEPPGPDDTAAALDAGRDAGPRPDKPAARAIAVDVGATFRVFATQYNPNTPGSVEVAVPDKCAKFASLGWTSALASADCPAGYKLGLDWRVLVRRESGQRLQIPVKDVGPWNVDDNYWNAADGPRPRRLFTDLPRGTPEAEAAFYDGYNTVSNCETLSGSPSGRSGAADQFGRCVLNPAGIDLSVAAAAELGLGHLENEWVTVTFLWEGTSFAQSHVLWHDRNNGKTKLWTMSQTDLVRSSPITRRRRTNPPKPKWIPAATGDLNGDRRTDVLWWNQETNALLIWLMKDTTRIGRERIDGGGATVGPGWHPLGVDDFDSDGHPDVVWHDADSGRLTIWYLDRTTHVRSTTPVTGGSRPSSEWRPFATVDVDADDKPDVAWHNASTGAVMIWYLSGADGSTLRSSTVVTRAPGVGRPSPARIPIGAGHFAGDGAPDLLWHDTATGALEIWVMDGEDGSRATESVRVTGSSLPGPPKVPIVWR